MPRIINQNILWRSLSIRFQKWHIYLIIWLDSLSLWLTKLIIRGIIGLLSYFLLILLVLMMLTWCKTFRCLLKYGLEVRDWTQGSRKVQIGIETINHPLWMCSKRIITQTQTIFDFLQTLTTPEEPSWPFQQTILHQDALWPWSP